MDNEAFKKLVNRDTFDSVLERLLPVSRRFRQTQLLWLLTGILIIAAFFAFTMLAAANRGEVNGSSVSLTIAGLALLGSMIAFLRTRQSFGDSQWTAEQVERQFPSLEQRLLTVVSDAKDSPKTELGFLQREVIRETRDHSRQHDWRQAAPRSRWLLGAFACVFAATTLAFSLSNLARAKPLQAADRSSNSITPATPQIDFTIFPGNTEIERGSSLVVTARFNGKVPPEGTLLITDSDGKQKRLSMTQNLEDPILGGFIAAVDGPIKYEVITSDLKSDQFQVDVFEFPGLVRSDATLDYPTYTELPQKRIEDTVRVSAVQGTKVTWECLLNKQVETAELVTKDGERLALSMESIAADGSVRMAASLDLQSTKRYTLELLDADGRKNKFPPELVARVLPNRPPSLKLTSARDRSVSPLEEMPIGAEVRDDFGITRLGISYTFADLDPQELVLEDALSKSVKHQVSHMVAFEDMQAEPDQLYSYYFWAEDFGPDGKVRRIESDMFFAEVRPFEEIYREGQSPAGGQQQQQQQQQGNQNGQKAEELANLQKEIINATWNLIRNNRDEPLGQKFIDDVNVVRESQGDALAQLEELAQEVQDEDSKAFVDAVRNSMTKTIDQLNDAVSSNSARPLNQAIVSEKASYGGLLKLRAREFEIVRQQQQQSQSQSQNSSAQQRQQQLDELELNQDENRYEQQQQAQESSEEEQAQREVRQILSRLRELAKRQEDLNEQLAELQSALEQAETEEEREEIERRLKRLREQQQELLRETDELSERMQQPENQESMREQRERLEQTRENVRKASEALEQQEPSQALTAGRRAEREFEEMRDEFRQRAAGQFNDTVREMRSTARELEQRQEQITKDMQELESPRENQPGLRGDNKRKEIEEAFDQQQQELNELLDQMKQTVEEAEVAEPLLAQKLYDSFRKTQQRQVDQKLDNANELFQRGFDEEAKQFEESAREGIGELREELEEAAKSVLGDEDEALRRALGQLEQLSRDLEAEIDREDPAARQPNQRGGSPSSEGTPSDEPGTDGQGEPTDPNNRSDQPTGEGEAGNQRERPDRRGDQASNQGQNQPQDSDEQPNGDQPSRSGQPQNEQGQPSQDRQPGQQGQSNGQAGNTNNENQQPNGEQPSQGSPTAQPTQSPSENQSGQPGSSEQSGDAQQPADSSQQPTDRQAQDAQQRSSQQASSGQSPTRGGNESAMGGFAADGPTGSPIAGDGFREWTDRLRDVEEMVEDPDLRSRAARIRDRAREVRLELKRHSKNPQWRLVDKMIAQPLQELKRDVQEELLRRSAEKNTLVPIDRDPVPDQYSDAVRKYYENLGAGK